MLLNTIFSAATTAFILMAPAATMAQPVDASQDQPIESREFEHLDARAFDMRLQWSGNSGCSALGPVRDYSRNVCIPLSDNTWAVKIIDHNSRCKSKIPSPLLFCPSPFIIPGFGTETNPR